MIHAYGLLIFSKLHVAPIFVCYGDLNCGNLSTKSDLLSIYISKERNNSFYNLLQYMLSSGSEM